MQRGRQAERSRGRRWPPRTPLPVQIAHYRLQRAISLSDPRAAPYAIPFESPPPPPGVDLDGKLISARLSLSSRLAYLNHRPTFSSIRSFLRHDPLHVLDFRRGLLTTFLGWLEVEESQQVSRIDAISFYTMDGNNTEAKAGFGLYVLYEAIHFEVSVPLTDSHSRYAMLDENLMQSVQDTQSNDRPDDKNMDSDAEQRKKQDANQGDKWSVFVFVERLYPGASHDNVRTTRVGSGSVKSNVGFNNLLQDLSLAEKLPELSNEPQTPWHLIAFPSNCIHTSRVRNETVQEPSTRASRCHEGGSMDPPVRRTMSEHSVINRRSDTHAATSGPDIPRQRTLGDSEPSTQQSCGQQRPSRSATARQAPSSQQQTSVPPRPTDTSSVLTTTVNTNSYERPKSSGQAENNRQEQAVSSSTHKFMSTFTFPRPSTQTHTSKSEHASLTHHSVESPSHKQGRRARNIRLNTKGRMPLMEGNGIREQFWEPWMAACSKGEVGIVWWESEEE